MTGKGPFRDCDMFVVMRPVSDLKDGEPQVEAIASSFDELYGISPTFHRVAKGEGLNLRPEISVDLRLLPVDRLLIFGGKPVRFNA